MKTILIRELPQVKLLALKRLARLHHRSLQGELHAIIDRAIEEIPQAQSAGEIEIKTVRTGRSDGWRREELYDDDGR